MRSDVKGLRREGWGPPQGREERSLPSFQPLLPNL